MMEIRYFLEIRMLVYYAGQLFCVTNISVAFTLHFFIHFEASADLRYQCQFNVGVIHDTEYLNRVAFTNIFPDAILK